MFSHEICYLASTKICFLWENISLYYFLYNSLEKTLNDLPCNLWGSGLIPGWVKFFIIQICTI